MPAMTGSQRATLAAAVLGSGIVFLDGSVVTVALPRIGVELPATAIGVLEGQTYIFNGYMLSLSALLILAGALTDRNGRKRVCMYGLIGFGLASAICGAAPSLELLIAARVLQGAAGAFIIPGSLALLTAGFDGEARGRAFGIWASASALTAIIGPLIGGLLVDALSWRAVFFVNVPLVAVTVWIMIRGVTESRDETASTRLDWLGAVVGAVAVGGLTLGLTRGQEQLWADGLAWVALASGAAAAVAFPIIMRRPHALIPAGLFRSRNFTVINVSTFLIYAALYVTLYYLTIFLQGTLGYTATAAGMATIPAILFLAFFSGRFGRLSGRFGPRWFMAIGPAVMALGTWWLARIPADSGSWRVTASDPASFIPSRGYLVDVLPGLVVFGLGAMVMVAPLTTALMSSIPVNYAGVGSAVNNAISRIGPQLAGGLIFIALTGVFYGSLAEELGEDRGALRERFAPLNPAPPDADQEETGAAARASTEGFSLAMLLGAGLLAAGAVVNGIGIRNETLVVPTEITPESLAGQMCVPIPAPPETIRPGEAAAAT